MSHYLRSVIDGVEATHSRLGKAAAFSIIAAKGRKCLIFIAPAGMGKSTTSNYIAGHCDESMIIDAVSEAGIGQQQDKFSGYTGLVTIDDLGKLGSHYRRIKTLLAMAELTYSHYMTSYMFGNPIDIKGFHGACVLNTQPAILQSLVQSEEWEVVLQDKTIRYYHLFRPEHPIYQLPEPVINWGIDFDLVKPTESRGKMWRELGEIGRSQWSDTRVFEHISDLLRATAALDGRQEVDNSDFKMLLDLIKPLTIERYVSDKYSFESGRHFKPGLLALLIEVASWEKLNINHVARDYKLSPKRAGELVVEHGLGIINYNAFTKVLKPTKDLARVLKEAGV